MASYGESLRPVLGMLQNKATKNWIKPVRPKMLTKQTKIPDQIRKKGAKSSFQKYSITSNEYSLALLKQLSVKDGDPNPWAHAAFPHMRACSHAHSFSLPHLLSQVYFCFNKLSCCVTHPLVSVLEFFLLRRQRTFSDFFGMGCVEACVGGLPSSPNNSNIKFSLSKRRVERTCLRNRNGQDTYWKITRSEKDKQ